MLALHGYKLRGRPMIISFSKSKLKTVGPATTPSSSSSSDPTEAVSTSADYQDQTASDNNSTTAPSQ